MVENCVIRADCQERAICTLCHYVCWMNRREMCAAVEGGFNAVFCFLFFSLHWRWERTNYAEAGHNPHKCSYREIPVSYTI